MKINVVAIAKPENDCYAQLCDHFSKMAKRYAKLEAFDLFNTKITRAQESGVSAAQKSYAQQLEPWLERGYTVALDPAGAEMESEQFAKLLANRTEVTFLIGGAYGHGDTFLARCDRVISLSRLTMSHKVAKVMLFEQIYRGLTINHNHPYHK
ncbi:23S rRNA (pseudouridine(1915)-N(3))-methyltransferase RlmH [Hydrogenimonas urashimensis]|uniref:23S rRNA (pseudouridine(1915)-N(3))-methyltransferase RlmH n=1 Tax=Hydrogenimonas urashimensis TaxID=2740515 RepID=UPI00191563EA|nr:23S rRNA (pseudouridine(1915)-N(3))-methyltransferase RlmH [Hydrogenimonas urashimensis]